MKSIFKNNFEIGLFIAAILFMFFMHFQIKYLEDNRSLGLIDDGKTQDRIVWVPETISYKFQGPHLYFDLLPTKDKQKFIIAMNNKDYDTEAKIYNKYWRRDGY